MVGRGHLDAWTLPPYRGVIRPNGRGRCSGAIVRIYMIGLRRGARTDRFRTARRDGGIVCQYVVSGPFAGPMAEIEEDWRARAGTVAEPVAEATSPDTRPQAISSGD